MHLTDEIDLELQNLRKNVERQLVDGLRDELRDIARDAIRSAFHLESAGANHSGRADRLKRQETSSTSEMTTDVSRHLTPAGFAGDCVLTELLKEDVVDEVDVEDEKEASEIPGIPQHEWDDESSRKKRSGEPEMISPVPIPFCPGDATNTDSDNNNDFHEKINSIQSSATINSRDRASRLQGMLERGRTSLFEIGTTLSTTSSASKAKRFSGRIARIGSTSNGLWARQLQRHRSDKIVWMVRSDGFDYCMASS
jgi:hypothetical protein